MTSPIPVLEVDKSLPPFLECLPLAFESPSIPSTLLPLLSPILRQRVRLHSDECNIWTASWIPLLCWDSLEAEELISIAQHDMHLEASLATGKMDLGLLEDARYRKLDEETLEARTRAPRFSITIIYTWCTNDTEGADDGWRISSVKPYRSYSDEDSSLWYSSVDEAYDKYGQVLTQSKSLMVNQNTHANGNNHTSNDVKDEDDDEDLYWSQYDQRQSESPAGVATTGQGPTGGRSTNDEDDYYNRYDDVQPEMDAENPSEDATIIGQSSLPGNLLTHSQNEEPGPNQAEDHIVHTKVSPASSPTVIHLEQTAQQQSQAEIAIQQHVSASIKNLYRLTRGAGIDVVDFKRLVDNEMDCLGMMEEE